MIIQTLFPVLLASRALLLLAVAATAQPSPVLSPRPQYALGSAPPLFFPRSAPPARSLSASASSSGLASGSPRGSPRPHAPDARAADAIRRAHRLVAQHARDVEAPLYRAVAHFAPADRNGRLAAADALFTERPFRQARARGAALRARLAEQLGRLRRRVRRRVATTGAGNAELRDLRRELAALEREQGWMDRLGGAAPARYGALVHRLRQRVERDAGPGRSGQAAVRAGGEGARSPGAGPRPAGNVKAVEPAGGPREGAANIFEGQRGSVAFERRRYEPQPSFANIR